MWKNRAPKSVILQGFLRVVLGWVRYLYSYPQFRFLFVYTPNIKADSDFSTIRFDIKLGCAHIHQLYQRLFLISFLCIQQPRNKFANQFDRNTYCFHDNTLSKLTR